MPFNLCRRWVRLRMLYSAVILTPKFHMAFVAWHISPPHITITITITPKLRIKDYSVRTVALLLTTGPRRSGKDDCTKGQDMLG